LDRGGDPGPRPSIADSLWHLMGVGSPLSEALVRNGKKKCGKEKFERPMNQNEVTWNLKGREDDWGETQPTSK